MSSNRHINWLHEESRQWVADGVINADQASQLHARYPESGGWSWGMYLLSALGAIVFGLGVVLAFAYNWSELHKYAKLGVIFGALLLAHIIAVVIGRKSAGQTSAGQTGFGQKNDGRNDAGRTDLPNRNLTEGFHLLGTMMFGAGIWLIAQIYHVDEHYPMAFAIWGLGALAMAWALPSVIQGIVAALLLTAWGSTELLDFQSTHFLSIACLVFGVIGLAFFQRSRALLFFGLLGVLCILLGNVFIVVNVEAATYVIFSVALLLIVVARLSRVTQFLEAANVIRGFGIVIYAVFLFVLSFNDVAREVVEPMKDKVAYTYCLALLLFTALCWGALLYDSIVNRHSRAKLIEMSLVCVAIVLMLLMFFGAFGTQGGLYVLLINGVLAAHCVVLIFIGTSELNWRHVAIGCFTLLVQVFSRFNDLFESLLMRSLVFLVVGAILFFIGHIYSKSTAKGQANA